MSLHARLDAWCAEMLFQSMGIIPQQEYNETAPCELGRLLLQDVKSMHCMRSVLNPYTPIMRWLTEIMTVGGLSTEQLDSAFIEMSVYRAGIDANNDLVLSSECGCLIFRWHAEKGMTCDTKEIGKIFSEMHNECPVLRMGLVVRRHTFQGIQYPVMRVRTNHLIAGLVWTACSGISRISIEDILGYTQPQFLKQVVQSCSIYHQRMYHSNIIMFLMMQGLENSVLKDTEVKRSVCKPETTIFQIDIVIILRNEMMIKRQYSSSDKSKTLLESLDSIVSYFSDETFVAFAVAYCFDGLVRICSWIGEAEQNLHMIRLDPQKTKQAMTQVAPTDTGCVYL
jgi:hypothetical protein